MAGREKGEQIAALKARLKPRMPAAARYSAFALGGVQESWPAETKAHISHLEAALMETEVSPLKLSTT